MATELKLNDNRKPLSRDIFPGVFEMLIRKQDTRWPCPSSLLATSFARRLLTCSLLVLALHGTCLVLWSSGAPCVRAWQL